MASFGYVEGCRGLIDNTNPISLEDDTLQLLLVSTTYEAIALATLRDKVFVDDGGADDPASHEISVTGYTPGFSGTGRKTLASKAVATDAANDRAEFDCADVTWTALGAGATIGGAVLYQRGSADTDSRLIAFFDLTNTPTNGSDISLVIDAEGLLSLASAT